MGWLHVFSSFPPRPPPRPPPQRLLPLTSKPFKLNFGYLGKRIYRSGKYTGWPFHDLHPRSRLWHRLAKNSCLHNKVRTTYPITTQRASLIALVIIIAWSDFEDVLLEAVISSNFLLKFQMCFYMVEYYYGHISGMVGVIDVKRKEKHRLDIGYDIWPWPQSRSWHWMFQSQISK